MIQHLRDHKETIFDLWPSQFIVTKSYNIFKKTRTFERSQWAASVNPGDGFAEISGLADHNKFHNTYDDT